MNSRAVWHGWYFLDRILTQRSIFLRHVGSLSEAFSYMTKCPFFTDAAIAAASISGFVSKRFPYLHQSHQDDSLLLSSYASFDGPFSRAAERKYHLWQLPSKMKNLCPHAGVQIWTPGASAAVGTSQSPGPIREETDGHLGTGAIYFWLWINFGSSSRDPNTQQGGGSLRAQKYACRCLLALWLWQVIANRLCLVSTDTYGWCWHRDRWAARCPLGLPLMASTRMDGPIFKVSHLTFSLRCVHWLIYKSRSC